MYQRILVPLDGSEVAKQALPYAVELAKGLGARIDLLEAVTPFPRELIRNIAREEGDDGLAYPPSLDQWTEVESRYQAAARERLDQTAGPLREAGLQVDTLVVASDPQEAIAKAAQEQPGTVIAISTHGRSGIGRWFMGSVTDKVIRLSEQPVLVVRAREAALQEPRIARLILPLDGTEVSEAAIPHAVGIAKGLGIGITLLRSISPLAYGDTFADYVPAMYQDLAAEIDADVQSYLSEIAARVRAEGVDDVDERAPDGYAATAIIDAAGKEGDKLVVMATHARSGVGRWVLGSVTDRVVRHAAAPVLVIHPQKPR